jgi:hypothetical protein
MTDLPAPPPPSQDRRDLIVQRLSNAFAAGRIEMEDLERRLEVAMRAQTAAELESAMKGLEAGPQAAQPESDVEPALVPAPPFGADRPKASRHTFAVLSGTTRRGRWMPAQQHVVHAIMGGAKLDLREAELLPGITEIRVHVLMGGVSIIVSPDVDVEVEGWAILGGIGGRDIHPAPLESQTKRVLVRARVVMGGVEVKVRERKKPRSAPEIEEGDEVGELRRRKRLRGE